MTRFFIVKMWRDKTLCNYLKIKYNKITFRFALTFSKRLTSGLANGVINKSYIINILS